MCIRDSRYPGSPRRKRWILGVGGIDPFCAGVNAISIPPGKYDRKIKMCIRDRYLIDNSKYNLEYIQAWLSHWFTDEIFKTIGSDFEGGFYTHGTSMYKDIPLLPIDFENENEVNAFDRITEWVKKISSINEDIENETDIRKNELNLRIKENIISKINTQIDELIKSKMEENHER